MSKLVTNRQKSATALASMLQANTEGLQRALAAKFSGYLAPGEVFPSISLLMTLAQRHMDASIQQATEADRVHALELGDDGPILQQRDEQSAALYRGIISFREALGGVFGAEVLPRFGLKGNTPQDPVVLLEYVQNVIALVRKGPLPLPKEEGISYDPSRRLDALEEAHGALSASLREVAKEKREAQETLTNRDRAVDAYDTAYSQAANFLVGIFSLAGLSELAERVRPTARRIARPGGDSGEEEAPAGGSV